jgi:peptidoglycan hydrolase-like protein with peptidoglycan-binding domain
VPNVVLRLRVSAALAVITTIALALLLAAGADAATRYRPALVSTSGGGASMDRFHHLGARALRAGARGHDVRVAQDYLRRAGFKLRVDGLFGPGMARIVQRFERANGLRADGRLSLADIVALRNMVDRGVRVRSVPALPPTDMRAGINPDGTATAPSSAPPAVQAIIAAANRIATLPYRYGGGHGKWEDTAYDCSGSVSYALHGASLLSSPLASGDLMHWGAPGAGEWVTVYANGGHAYMTVAGLRFDTSGRSSAGTRWQRDMRASNGYTIRHPAGL